MEPRFEDGAAVVVAGLRGHYHTTTKQEIPKLWDRFAPFLREGAIPSRMGPGSYGVCFDGDGKGGFEYLAGVAVSGADGVPAELTTVETLAGRYAVFSQDSDLAKLPGTWAAAFAWMPGSGYRMLAAPYYERYSEDFSPENGTGRIEIWMPVEAAIIS